MTKPLEALIADMKEQLQDAKASWIDSNSSKVTLGWIYSANPLAVEALIAALEQSQQYAKDLDAENQDLMLTVGRLRVERERLEASRLAVKLPNGLIEAVKFYEQVQRENPAIETGAWKDATDWVLKEAIRAAGGTVQGDE